MGGTVLHEDFQQINVFFLFISITNLTGMVENIQKITISTQFQKKKKKIVKINCCCRGRGYEVR